jgi:hypothetical protein
MNNKYVLWVDDKECGPFTIDEVQSMVNQGKVLSTVQARRESEVEWFSWVDVPSSLLPSNINPPPVIPPPTSTKGMNRIKAIMIITFLSCIVGCLVGTVLVLSYKLSQTSLREWQAGNREQFWKDQNEKSEKLLKIKNDEEARDFVLHLLKISKSMSCREDRAYLNDLALKIQEAINEKDFDNLSDKMKEMRRKY